MDSGLRPSIFYLSVSPGVAGERREALRGMMRSIGFERLEEEAAEWGGGREVLLISSECRHVMREGGRLVYLDCYPPDISNRLPGASLPDRIHDLAATLDGLDGFFAGVIVERGRVVIFRDHVGAIPIVVELGAGGLEAASFSSMLVGGRHAPPGRIIVWDGSSLKIYRWRRRREVSGNMVEELASKLTEAVSRHLPEGSVLAFSGGLDSVVLAYLASKTGKRITCVTVATEGALDLSWAEESAYTLGVDLKKIVVPPDRLEELAALFLRRLLRPSLMDLSLASLFYMVASSVRGEVVVSGQGADEMFGGYHKYVVAYGQRGPKYVEGIMARDLLRIHETNIERDYLACCMSGKRLVLPYLSRPLYDMAASIPAEYKFLQDGKLVGKALLRAAAKRLGVPETLVERPKKAAQYSSNIQRHIERIVWRWRRGGELG